MSHTPGPWEWWTSNSLLRLSARDTDGGILYAVNYRDGVPDIVCPNEDDRPLIESAPDLLEALEQAVASLPQAGDVDSNGYTEVQYSPIEWEFMIVATKQARAAINKARGK